MPSFNDFTLMVHNYDPLRDQKPTEIRHRSLLRAEQYANNPRPLNNAFRTFFRMNDTVFLTRKDVFSSASEDNVHLFVLKVLLWGFPTNLHGICRFVFESWNNVISFARDILASPDLTREYYLNHYVPIIGRCRRVSIAFFSKLMYFAGASIDGHRCIILDSRVRKGIGRIQGERLDGLRNSIRRYNNYRDYAEYVAQISLLNNNPLLRVSPDRIEYALFCLGSSIN